MDGPGDWLMSLISAAKNGGSGSPFGAMNGGAGVAPPSQGQPMNIVPQGAAGATQGIPGLLGKFFNQQQPQSQQQPQPQNPGQNPQQPQNQPATNQANSQLLQQAMGLMKQPQIQAPQWMPWMGR